MTTTRLRVAIAVAAGLVAVAALAVVFLGVADDEDGGEDQVAAVQPTTSTTAGAPSTTAAPATAATTTTTVQGTVLSPADGYLVPPARPSVQSNQGESAACAALIEANWTLSGCGSADMAGGQRVWLVAKRGEFPNTIWQAKVVHWDRARGAWLIDLAFGNETAAGRPPELALQSVNVKAADLDGDGKAELVFGYRTTGTGAYLSYDIVTDRAGGSPAVAAARRGLNKGQALVAGGVITDFAADAGAPACCPRFWEKSMVRFSGGSYRVVPSAQVPELPAGPFDL